MASEFSRKNRVDGGHDQEDLPAKSLGLLNRLSTTAILGLKLIVGKSLEGIIDGSVLSDRSIRCCELSVCAG